MPRFAAFGAALGWCLVVPRETLAGDALTKLHLSDSIKSIQEHQAFNKSKTKALPRWPHGTVSRWSIATDELELLRDRSGAFRPTGSRPRGFTLAFSPEILNLAGFHPRPGLQARVDRSTRGQAVSNRRSIPVRTESRPAAIESTIQSSHLQLPYRRGSPRPAVCPLRTDRPIPPHVGPPAHSPPNSKTPCKLRPSPSPEPHRSDGPTPPRYRPAPDESRDGVPGGAVLPLGPVLLHRRAVLAHGRGPPRGADDVGEAQGRRRAAFAGGDILPCGGVRPVVARVRAAGGGRRGDAAARGGRVRVQGRVQDGGGHPEHRGAGGRGEAVLRLRGAGAQHHVRPLLARLCPRSVERARGGGARGGGRGGDDGRRGPHGDARVPADGALRADLHAGGGADVRQLGAQEAAGAVRPRDGELDAAQRDRGSQGGAEAGGAAGGHDGGQAPGSQDGEAVHGRGDFGGEGGEQGAGGHEGRAREAEEEGGRGREGGERGEWGGCGRGAGGGWDRCGGRSCGCGGDPSPAAQLRAKMKNKRGAGHHR